MEGTSPMSAFGTGAALCASFHMVLLMTAAVANASNTAAEEAPHIVVTCDGPVEMTRLESGRTRLVLSGGVRVERGELTVTARRGRVEIDRESETPEVVLVEGDVVIDSPRFGAKAGAAWLRQVEVEPEGNGPPAGDFTVTLERRDRSVIDLRAGTVRLTCGGPVVYHESSGEIAVAGRLRAETGTFVARAESGVITLERSAPGPGKEGGALGRRETEGAGHPVEGTPSLPPALLLGPVRGVERIELEGGVEIHTSPAEGPERRARASRAIYIGAEDVIVLLGDPGPEIESDGVLLTAPEEMRMYITENRIEAPRGRMRAVIGPRRPDRTADLPARPKPLRRGEGPTSGPPPEERGARGEGK